jgi:DNA mismatch repair protein MutL
VLAGGFQLIRISDDGIGMSQDDAVLSLERHATSKVRKIEDLLSVYSMGFRGEALASISAISKLTLITCQKEILDHQGVRVVCEGGKIRSVGMFSRQAGTTLEIASLFYTVPARKKFQKSPPQALAEIHKTMLFLALARPDVAFILQSHEDILLQADQGGLDRRIQDVLGDDYFQSVLPIFYEESWIKIEGFIGKPSKARSNKTGQYLFMNKRAVVSSGISFAVADGYCTMLEARKHPIFVLHITLDPQLLDINVHPQKKEVRFKDESAVKVAIRKAVNFALQGGEKRSSLVKSSFFEEHAPMSIETLFEDFDKKPQNPEMLYGLSRTAPIKPLVIQQDLLPWESVTLPKVDDLEIVGIHRGYLFIEGSSAHKIFQLPAVKLPYEGLLIVDLKACRSRIYFDKVVVGSSVQDSIEMQALLFPIILQVTAVEAHLFEAALPIISQLGIQMRLFGENTFIIEACIKGLSEEKLKQLLYECLDEMRPVEISEIEKQKRLAIKIARTVGMGNARYDLTEAKAILSELLKTQNPYFCPAGKKTIGYMSIEQYDRFFN